MARLYDAARKLPPSTLGVVAACCCLFLVQVTSNLPLDRVSMCPNDVINQHQLYRMVSSSLFHDGIMHIGMNMMSTLPLSTLLEQELGTLRHIFTVFWAILLTNSVYIFVAYSASALFSYDKLMYQHAVGFSGVLFHMVVLESSLVSRGGAPFRTLFGVAKVPSWLYPWVL
jgi:membrane associated rhomboid family serine protease